MSSHPVIRCLSLVLCFSFAAQLAAAPLVYTGGSLNLADQTSDLLHVDNAPTGAGSLIINSINIIQDATDSNVTIVPAVSNNLRNAVKLGVEKVYSPIYAYDVAYDNTDGSLAFGARQSGSLDAYNPAVLAEAVGLRLGAYSAQLQAYNAALENVSDYPFFPGQKDRELWFKPYGGQEDVSFSNGPSIDRTAYGGLMGADSYARPMFGLDGFYSAYAGYMGARQKYDGVRLEQNGGLAGVGVTVYGDSFFAGLTLNGGYTHNEAKTSYGKENFNVWSAGAALKTGYNIDLPFWCLILQPNVTAAYTFGDAENYQNAVGVHIKSDVMHALTLSPGVKVMADWIGGWTPSIEAAGVWSFFNDSRFTANTASLPDLSIDPYVQYGVGLQKTWPSNFSVYAKVLGKSLGVRGVEGRVGVKLAL